jgi:hypothetical protein
MSSYLEAYGAAEEKRARVVRLLKITSISLVCAVLAGLILYGIFKNYSEEQRLKSFIALLQKKDYQGAYRMWGCSEAQPCPNYTFDKFIEDWGPASSHANEASAKIGLSQSCGTGVILRIDYNNAEPMAVWVERDSKIISFAPWPECPGRHLRIGAWLKSLFNRG